MVTDRWPASRKWNRCKVAIILAMFSMFIPVTAQKPFMPAQRDFETWNSGMLRYKFNKQWQFNLEEQFRMNNLSRSFGQLFTDASAVFRAREDMEFGIGFRHILDMDNRGSKTGLENHLRFYLDASLIMKIYMLRLDTRFRYQRRNELGVSRTEGDYPVKDYRCKSTLSWNISNCKWTPEISTELFYHAGIGEMNGIRRFRISAGAEYKINGNQKIGFRYLRQREIVVWNPEITHLVFVRYVYIWKRK